jgi:light-regulated signal transduction histidine kinase (bacteriophytochrome)
LRHISGFASLLSHESAGQLDSKACDYIEKIQRSAKRMGQMVDELLELSRCGRAALQLIPTDLAKLVDEAMAVLHPDWEGREIQWNIGPLPVLACDRTLMLMVFQNLLANAIKFTRQRTPAAIEVGQTAIDGRAAIFVRDNGVGFEMKYVGKLFGVFQRLHRAEEFEGTGIGLATVQRIVRKHGGEIWAQAELDKGATFFFTLAGLSAGATGAKSDEGAQP